MRTSRTAVGLIVSAGLLVGGGLAAGSLAATGALAASPSPTPTPSASASPGAPGDRDGDGGFGRHGGHGPGGMGGMGGMGRGFRDGVEQGRMLHGEIVVEKSGGGTETLLVQHGTVTAKTSDSVTVKSSDGFTATWKVTSDTAIRAGRPAAGAAKSTLADVKTGADVMVSGPKASGGGTARVLGVRPAGLPDGTKGGPKSPTPSATTSPATLNG